MLIQLLTVFALLLCGCVADVQSTPGSEQPAQITAFVNVTVIPMDHERILEHQTVMIRGDRIHEIGPVSRVRVPGEAVVMSISACRVRSQYSEVVARKPRGE